MPARLAATPLDGARAPLARLIVRDWILQGMQTLDGLLCLKARTGTDWPALILPWLEQAAEIRETENYALLLFAEPTEIDCAQLGALLPLKRQGGLLASAGIDAPVSMAGEALRDHLVVVLAGERHAVPLADFARTDIAELWDTGTTELMPAQDLPLLEVVSTAPPQLRTSSPLPFEPGDDAAGFEALRDRIQRSPRHRVFRGFGAGLRDRLRTPGTAFNGLARICAILFICGCVFLLWKLMPDFAVSTPIPSAPEPEIPRSPPSSPLPGIAILLGLLALFFLLGLRGRLEQAGTVAQQASARRTGAPGWLSRIIARLFGSGTSKPSPSTATGTAEAGAKSSQRGLLRRFAAWLVWSTPLRAGLQRKYALMLMEVERLFREGMTEEALKRALSLAKAREDEMRRKLFGTYGDMPLDGPTLRKRIELDLSGDDRPAAGGLSPEGYQHFAKLYREQAKKLIDTGDLEKAIFIFAELLDEPGSAVDLLAKAGHFETAARLAQARRLAPHVFIPLWFRAGDKDRALGLAARHDAFADLIAYVYDDDPFRAAVAKEWAQRLVASGHVEKALAVTEKYPEGIESERRDWLRAARQDTLDGETLNGELLARMLKLLPWEASPHDDVYRDFLTLLDTGTARAAAERLRLAIKLADTDFEQRSCDAGFDSKLPLLAHLLTRRMLADEAAFGHDPLRSSAADALSRRGGLFALRTDLRRLAKVPPTQKAERPSSLELPASPTLIGIVDALALPGGKVLVGTSSGLVRLMRLDGKELWRSQVDGLHGFVPVGEGYKVLLVHDAFEERHLSVLDIRTLEYRERGLFPVGLYHRWATSNGWLVFSGSDIVCLDLPSLLESQARLEDRAEGLTRHWSLPMGEPGSPLFFIDRPSRIHFAYLRVDGLIEWWFMDRDNLKIACNYWSNAPRSGAVDKGYDNDVISAAVFWSLTDGMTIRTWDAENSCTDVMWDSASRTDELEMIVHMRRSPPSPLVPIEPMASPEAPKWIAFRHERGVAWRCGLKPPDSDFEIFFTGAASVRAHPLPESTQVAVVDDLGRLVVVDIAEKRVLMQIT